MEKKQYVVVEFEWIGCKTYRETMCSCKGVEMIYNILRRYVIRDNMDHKVSKYIFDNFYSKNILASSVTYSHLNLLTNMSMTSIKKCLATLSGAGFIKIDATKSVAGEKQNIYILGKRKPYTDDNGMLTAKDFWFVDDIVSEEIMKKRIESCQKM
jgi:hypothetical protein